VPLFRRFTIPQSARDGLGGSSAASSTATGTGKRTRDDKDTEARENSAQSTTEGTTAGGPRTERAGIDFAALEKEVLRITAAGAKHTRNPVTPLPSAASGPFSPAGRDYK
jgi:hypothetical protein